MLHRLNSAIGAGVMVAQCYKDSTLLHGVGVMVAKIYKSRRIDGISWKHKQIEILEKMEIRKQMMEVIRKRQVKTLTTLKYKKLINIILE